MTRPSHPHPNHATSDRRGRMQGKRKEFRSRAGPSSLSNCEGAPMGASGVGGPAISTPGVRCADPRADWTALAVATSASTRRHGSRRPRGASPDERRSTGASADSTTSRSTATGRSSSVSARCGASGTSRPRLASVALRALIVERQRSRAVDGFTPSTFEPVAAAREEAVEPGAERLWRRGGSSVLKKSVRDALRQPI